MDQDPQNQLTGVCKVTECEMRGEVVGVELDSQMCKRSMACGAVGWSPSMLHSRPLLCARHTWPEGSGSAKHLLCQHRQVSAAPPEHTGRSAQEVSWPPAAAQLMS